MKKLAIPFAVLGLLAMPAMASAAAIAHANATVSLRSGPDAGYPRVATLPAGATLEVYGCVDDWSWCDVGADYDRGWVFASFLDYYDHGRPVAISYYGARIGLPVLNFVFNAYWNDHYRNRSWYSRRNQWAAYHPMHRPVVVAKPEPHPAVAIKPQPRPFVAVKPRPPKSAKPQRLPQQRASGSDWNDRDDHRKQAARRDSRGGSQAHAR